jgi:hypothetical protein
MSRLSRWTDEITRSGTRSSKVIYSFVAVLAIVTVILRLHQIFSNAILPGGDWRIPGQHLLDFRDLIYTPGRYLLGGGNPYDAPPYLDANPNSQEFDLYAPMWLWLSALLGWLPYFVGAFVYEALGIVALLALSVLSVRAARAPRQALVSLVVFTYLLLWYPSRTATENGSSLFVTLGVTTALLNHRTRTWVAAAGVAVSLIKPQFGLTLVLLLLAARGWNVVWRGVAVGFLASLPPLLWCITAAGGIGEFVASLGRNLDYANSAVSATGLGYPDQIRIDTMGAVSRTTMAVPPAWLQAAVIVAVTAVGCAALWLRRPDADPLDELLTIAATILLAFVHLPYDLVLIVTPAVCVIFAALRGERHDSVARIVSTASVVLLLVHVHAVDRILLPGVRESNLNTIDTVLLAACWVGAILSVTRTRRHHGIVSSS